MKNYLSITVLLSSFLLLMACSDSAVNNNTADLLTQNSELEAEYRAPAPGDQTIAEIVVASASAEEGAEFTLLLAALEYTELTGVFTGGGQYTVFAPTDEAFLGLVAEVAGLLDDEILDEEGPFAAIDALLGEGTVANVLRYHVTEGRRAANSVVPNNPRAKERKISTLLEGASFTVNSDAGITAVGNTASIVTPNLSASNGIIHVIDKVLLPVDLGLE